jgi:hypothetical protein
VNEKAASKFLCAVPVLGERSLTCAQDHSLCFKASFSTGAEHPVLVLKFTRYEEGGMHEVARQKGHPVLLSARSCSNLRAVVRNVVICGICLLPELEIN